MNRVFVLISSLALLASGTLQAAEKPNVLFIAVDDLNDWAGYRGNQDAITPNMDRLAGQGMWFSQAYCQYPLCGPSRASIMSGLYYHQLGSTQLQADDAFVEDQAQAIGSELLHGYLKNHGYKTMAVGKIQHRHLAPKKLDLSGGRGGWDYFKDEQGKRTKVNFLSGKTLTDWAVYPYDEDKMSDSKAARWAVERLEEKHEEPFMLMVGFLRPHAPWYVPQKYFDQYDKDKLVLPPYDPNDFDDLPEAALGMLNQGYPRTEWAIQENQWRDIIHAYMASITFADAKVGEVLDALDASPYRDNTIVILWSDHGYHMGEKNTFQKHTLWNRSAVAPLIIKVPQSVDHNAKTGPCDQVVSLIDLYPTVVDLCGLPPNDVVVGRSLKPLLENPARPWDFPAFTFKRDTRKSVQYGPYRYIEYEDGSMELYDHRKDPNEWTNLAENPEHKQVLQRLQAMFTEYKTFEKKIP
ncbi:Arylsulfatase [Novipirellula aureliae]|uniref:Arylsulfatase n=1 Tax=Novipirellula aureliae TaxID=2527966 RepID=A0A5C6DVK3_9BACT|nr:sulfatase [Novipirellula aureliae]TWU38829.1 Arylsulfatase [Novipirellula aureliae]